MVTLNLNLQLQTVPVLTLPRITGMHAVNDAQSLTVDTSTLGTVQSIAWEVDGVPQGETTATISKFGVTAGSYFKAIVTDENGTHESPEFALYDTSLLDDNTIEGGAALMNRMGHDNATHIAVSDGNWLDASTWHTGTVPGEGALPLIPRGRSVTYNETADVRLDDLRIEGALVVNPAITTRIKVESLVITQGGSFTIGSGFGDRMAAGQSFTLTISDRHYATDADSPTGIDLASDPFLVSRGIMCMGLFRVFGDFRTRHAKTADNNPPMSGDTSITMASVPADWQVGDEIIIAGTAFEQIGGATTLFDERRTITGIAGDVVSFSGGLTYDHDHHNGTVTRTDLQPSIANVTTNVTVRSENTDAQKRGHIMIMGMGRSDVWDIGVIDMGRTDTTGNPGNILTGGQFEYYDDASSNVIEIATPAGANSKGRYPFHFHLCGFNRNEVPNIHNSVIDGSPGWGLVHHGCEADLFDNLVFNWSGAGIVAETGDETGPWVRNFSFGCNNQVNASYSLVKIADGGERGLKGDFGRHGVGMYFRGRAVRTVDNVVASSSTGYAFFHRGYSDPFKSLSDHRPIERENIDISDLAAVGLNNEIRHTDYPIAHMTRNEALGCYNGLSVSKAAPEQHHDIMTQLKDFRAWGVYNAMDIEYVGNYILLEPDVVSSAFPGSGYSYSTAEGIVFSSHTVQMTMRQATIEGFATGAKAIGGVNAVTGTNNSQFSATDPRFMIDRNTYINCTTDLELNDGGDAVPTANVTIVYTDASPPTLVAEPSVTVPFIVMDWNGSAAFGNTDGFSNIQTGLKTDSVGNDGALPKEWDNMMLRPESDTGLILDNYGKYHGYNTYGAENLLVFHQFYSDRLTARPIRKAHAVRLTNAPSGTFIARGEWPALSANAPVCADIALNVAVNGSKVIDISAQATDADGGTLTLAASDYGPVYFAPASGRAVLDTAAGTVTYTPDFGYSGPDEMYVWVTDGTGHYDTVKVTFNVLEQTVPVILTVGQSNTPGALLETELNSQGFTNYARLATHVGGSGVAKFDALWNVETGDGEDAPGQAYLDCIADIDAHLAANPDHFIAAVVTSQGEADMASADYANNGFRDAAIALIDAIRSHVGNPSLPWFQFTLSDYQTFYNPTDIQAVRAQQLDVATQRSNVFTIDTDAVFAANGVTQASEVMNSGEAPNYIHFFNGTYQRITALVDDPDFEAAITVS